MPTTGPRLRRWPALGASGKRIETIAAVFGGRATTRSFCGSSSPVTSHPVCRASATALTGRAVPDNYTDEETFLDHLQRNPRLQPYEFWSLMADATVIVQHIASVAIFCCSFAAIVQERVSPVSIVSWGSLCTLLGWALWDHWVGREEAAAAQALGEAAEAGEDSSSASSSVSVKDVQGSGLMLPIEHNRRRPGHSHSASATSMASDISAGTGPSSRRHSLEPNQDYPPPYVDPSSSLSPRNQQRLATAKSALLIYCALLGLSPILKSLTRSTTSDSIWAISTWLLCMNVAFFDYGEGASAQ